MKDLVGFYRTRETAERVKDELLRADFDRGDITIYDRGDQDEAGMWESIKKSFGYMDEDDRQLAAEAARRGLVAVGLCFDRDDSPETAVAIMRKYSPADLDGEAAGWKKAGWTGHQQRLQTAPTTTTATATAKTGTPAAAPAGQVRAEALDQGKAVVPVVQEQLHIGKREATTGGVRIYQRVTSRPVEEQVQLREEHVRVERRPVDRPVTAADAAFKERALEVTERQEKAVVAKEARVVEEVVVNKDVRQRTETVRDTVRRTDVDVQQVHPGQAAVAATTTFAPDTFADEIVRDERYRGRDWTAAEPDVQRTFEQRYPGSRWEQFKDAVHRGYDRARQKV